MSVECLWCTDRTSAALEEHTLCKGCRLILAATCPADMHRDTKPENVTLREAASDVYGAFIRDRYGEYPEDLKTAMAVLCDVLDGCHVVDPQKNRVSDGDIGPPKTPTILGKNPKKPVEPMELSDRGALIVEHASTCLRLYELSAALPEIEKLARKTPRKDMPVERAKVEAAKARVGPMRSEIVALGKRCDAMHERLEELGAYGQRVETAKGGSDG